jgi:hypothetical protein
VVQDRFRRHWDHAAQDPAIDRYDLARGLFAATHPRTTAWVAGLIHDAPDYALDPLLDLTSAPATAQALLDRLDGPLAIGLKRHILRRFSIYPGTAMMRLALCDRLAHEPAASPLWLEASRRLFRVDPDKDSPAVEAAETGLVLRWMDDSDPQVRAAGCDAAGHWVMRRDRLVQTMLLRLILRADDHDPGVARVAIGALHLFVDGRQGYFGEPTALWMDALAGAGDPGLERDFAATLAVITTRLGEAPPPARLPWQFTISAGEDEGVPPAPPPSATSANPGPDF